MELSFEPRDPDVFSVPNFSVTHKNKFPFLFKLVTRLHSLAPCVSSVTSPLELVSHSVNWGHIIWWL